MTSPSQPLGDASLSSARQLAAEADQALRGQLVEQALAARQKYGDLGPAVLERFLADRSCLRYPARLAFEFGDMAAHQFAQPMPDPTPAEPGGQVLCLRPSLRERPDLVVLAVAYMVPAIDYGDAVADDHCLLYGATLLGLDEKEFYRRLCETADWAGCEDKRAD